MPCDNANEVVELSQSRLSRYPNNLETSVRGSDYIFVSLQLLYYKCCSLQLLYYKCHRTNFRRSGW